MHFTIQFNHDLRPQQGEEATFYQRTLSRVGPKFTLLFLSRSDRYFFVVISFDFLYVTYKSKMCRDGDNLESQVQGWESPIIRKIGVSANTLPMGVLIQKHEGSYTVKEQCKLSVQLTISQRIHNESSMMGELRSTQIIPSVYDCDVQMGNN